MRSGANNGDLVIMWVKNTYKSFVNIGSALSIHIEEPKATPESDADLFYMIKATFAKGVSLPIAAIRPGDMPKVQLDACMRALELSMRNGDNLCDLSGLLELGN